jgi:hypothetical protein
MAALASDKQVILHDMQARVSNAVKTAVTIYDGSLVCLEDANGYARPCAIGLTAPEFLGIAVQQVVAGAGASGSKNITLVADCFVEVAAITNMTGVTDIGKPVYAINDNVDDLTDTVGAGGTLAVLVGEVVSYITDSSYGNRFRVHLIAASLV